MEYFRAVFFAKAAIKGGKSWFNQSEATLARYPSNCKWQSCGKRNFLQTTRYVFAFCAFPQNYIFLRSLVLLFDSVFVSFIFFFCSFAFSVHIRQSFRKRNILFDVSTLTVQAKLCTSTFRCVWMYSCNTINVNLYAKGKRAGDVNNIQIWFAAFV